MTLHAYTQYNSPLIRIDDYHCDGHTTHEDEEAALNHEIAFVRSGVFMRYDAFGRSVVDTNHVLFFNRNQPYHISHPVNSGDCCTVFTIADSTLRDLLQNCDSSIDNRPDAPFPVSHAPVDARQRLMQIQLLHALVSYEMVDSLAFDEEILLLLSDIVASSYRTLGRGDTATRPETRTQHTDMVNAVKVVLADMYYKQWTLGDIAEAVYSSPYHLCRTFRRETGQTIHHYRQHLRLYHALERIANTHVDDFMSLALELGFASHSHFSTVFLRTFGLSPSAFRDTVNTRTLHETRKILKV